MSVVLPPVPERQVARIEVDRELCIGAASCVAVAPEAFALDGKNIATVKPAWANLTDEQLLQAAIACPVAAILLYGPSGKRLYPES